MALGLSTQVDNRDLGAIRDFYLKFRDKGVEGAEEFSDVVHKLSGVSYNIMTNIPFDHNEAKNWQPNRKPCPDHYKTALRIDPFLSGDRNTVELALMQSGYDTTLDGARQFLRDWCDVLNPEYLMASTPHDFVWNDGTLSTIKNNSINLDAMKEPGAFAQAVKDKSSCDGSNDDSPSVVDENSDLLADVVMKVCEERDLPVALKIGAHRSLNPRLKAAGDGVVAFADAGMLGRLCSRFPKVRFLATFLSRNNQHEACVLALKFNNLHI